MVTSRTAWTPPKATLMSRISTSGVAPPRSRISLVACSGSAPAVEGVEADREDQDDAGHDVLAGRVDADEAEPVRERLHHEGAETAPGIVPMPPANEVPPTTAAAMTRARSSGRRRGWRR